MRKKNTFNEILPELLSITNLLEKKPSIQYFEGDEGIKRVYEDTLSYPNQEILVWISSEAVDCFNEDYLWKYAEKRKRNKIWQRSIGPDNKITRHLKITDEKYLRQSRLVSKDEMPFEVEINIYGGRFIGIMSFKEEIGLIIESKKIYNTLKSIFEMNWRTLE